MTSRNEPKVPRTDYNAALQALKRARKRAEELAALTGTAIVEWRDGKVVRMYPGRSPVDSPDASRR